MFTYDDESVGLAADRLAIKLVNSLFPQSLQGVQGLGKGLDRTSADSIGMLGTVDKPIVIRLDGNNAEEGRRILADAALPTVRPVDTMDGAAQLAAELAAAK